MRSMLRLAVVLALAVATQAARAGETSTRPEPRAGDPLATAPATGYDPYFKMDAIASYGAAVETGKAGSGSGGYDPYVKMDAIPSTTGGSENNQADEAFVQRIWWGP